MTQIIRGPKDRDGADETPETLEKNNNVTIDGNSESNIADDTANSPDSHDDFLSFLATDTAPIEDSTQCHGDMSDFNKALAGSKDVTNTGMWAKATANMYQVEDDEGFDTLVELFDASMEKSSSDRCIGYSQNSIDDDDDDDSCMSDELSLMRQPLTPSGIRVAKQIKTSVENDPKKEAAIERMCPNWKENVELAQAQTDPEDLQQALHNVQQAKTGLERMKDRILQAFLDRQHTLELYEKTLQGSIDRLPEEEDEDGCTD